MTEAVQRLLTAFEALSPVEQHLAVVEIQRRWQSSAPEATPAERVRLLLANLFHELNTQEPDEPAPEADSERDPE